MPVTISESVGIMKGEEAEIEVYAYTENHTGAMKSKMTLQGARGSTTLSQTEAEKLIELLQNALLTITTQRNNPVFEEK